MLAACGSKTGLDAPEPPVLEVDSSMPTPTNCVEVTPEQPNASVSFSVPASLAVIDLMFLIDATGSMRDEIEAVRRGLRESVVPGVLGAIPDAEFGVAFFGEFPFLPHGPDDVRPYELRTLVTSDLNRVEAALDSPPSWGNFDEPEALVEGLFQVLSGAGYASAGHPAYIPPSTGCPGGGMGGVCFREDALPIVMLITDAPMQQGPPGVEPTSTYRFSPSPHDYAEVLQLVDRVGALLLGLGATDGGRESPEVHLRQLLRDTDSFDVNGEPLYFDIGRRGTDIGDEIVEAVQYVASGVPLDIDALVEDVPGDAFDATTLVQAVIALRSEPSENVDFRGENYFLGVIPGTSLFFSLEIDISDLPPANERRVFSLRLVVRADGRSRITSIPVDIVVPGRDGRGC